MSLLVTIGSPQLVIHQGEAVWIAEPDGQVEDISVKGLMFRDTRLISNWMLFANGIRWELINGGAITHYAARVFLTNPVIPTENGTIKEHTLGFIMTREVDGGVHEDFDIANYGAHPVHFNLELLIRSDFGDVFEVKSSELIRRGRIRTDWNERNQELRLDYRNQDFHRGIVVRIKSPVPTLYANGRISFDVSIEPGKHWHACVMTDLLDGETMIAAPEHHQTPGQGDAVKTGAGLSLAAAREATPQLRTSNEEFYRFYHQALDDMVALRLPIALDQDHDLHLVPAAGLPWFVALFGRDSLIASLQTLPLTPVFARGAIAVLGARQSLERDDFRDAEPGKILHELRLGELAHFKLIPHTPYFGTADATPLWLMVLHGAWKWTGDRAMLERQLPTAERCLDWIEHWGDRDADGFQEYQTRSPRGYENMGWKDSGDGVLNADGSMVKGPKALCELQGYVYAAWVGMAEIYDVLGRPDAAAKLRDKAAAFQLKFDEAFWNDEFGGIVYALDGDKKQVFSRVSNVGHCLYTGLILPQRAQAVVDRLMGPDMFSGWGVRTLSAAHPAYNPNSYHNGSVWPHDNGILAQGMARYGFHEQAAAVARAVSGANSYFEMHQMPELYAGTPRDGGNFPVQFLGSNVPQAWAAGSVFSFLQAMLGLDADASSGMLYVDPRLPDWLPDVTLHGVHVGDVSFDLKFERHSGGAAFDVLSGPADKVALRARA